MEYVFIGRIINTHGIKGELKVESHTDFPKDRFKKDSIVYLGKNHEPMKVKSFRQHQGFILLLFSDLEDINLVEKYKGLNLYKDVADIKPLKKGEYYFKDLKNLDIYVSDRCVGKVIKVEEGTRNNYLRVNVGKEEKLIPFIKPFILNVDLENKRIDVVEMEGLL